MKKRFSLKQIKQKLRIYPNIFDPLDAELVIEIMREELGRCGKNEEDAIWLWSGGSTEIDDAYDRAMSIL